MHIPLFASPRTSAATSPCVPLSQHFRTVLFHCTETVVGGAQIQASPTHAYRPFFTMMSLGAKVGTKCLQLCMFLCFHLMFIHKSTKHACFHVFSPFSAYSPPMTS